jgi:hypothetical protein
MVSDVHQERPNWIMPKIRRTEQEDNRELDGAHL